MRERFIQLHLLTAYPPSNLNRDDLGRPKTAVMGGVTRLRTSSQSLKRAWRTSDVFEQEVKGNIGVRTKRMGLKIYYKLVDKGISHKNALDWAGKIAEQFGKRKTLSKKEKAGLSKLDPNERIEKELIELEIEQLAHFGPEELEAIDQLIDKMIKRGKSPEKEELALLRKPHRAVDIALFGRMLASSPAYNVEAAAQVAHAITVHKVAVEDDFFTAVDDLNEGLEDLGAAHMGEVEFGSGLFYLYICINRELLKENLGGDEELAKKAITALIKAAATVAPKGKQASFASRARASYILCERGDEQPRSLAVAFLEPVEAKNKDMLSEAINRLRITYENMDKVYGECAADRNEMNAQDGTGSLNEIIKCATE